jgi:hypothetical protein
VMVNCGATIFVKQLLEEDGVRAAGHVACAEAS